VLPKASMRALLLKTRDLLAEEQKAPSDKPLKPFEREGWGIGCFFYGNGRTSLSNPGIATVKISKDGLIEVGVGSPDIGQGSDTIFAQIAAEAMGIDSQHIIVKSADTRCTLDSGTTSGTRLTAIVGRAVEIASKKLRNTIIEYAARAYGVEATRIDLVSDADGLKLRATP
ncbi:MAG: molybdopterin-dependent oxidoreductase, partial [Clostridia bacterium]|nr:molybdopterin-dependent oxidoreductase [Clostridia bacterium]